MVTTPSVDSFMQDIPVSLAVSAFNGTSFDPEQRAETVRREYAQTLHSDFSALARCVKDASTAAALESAFVTYRAGLRRRWLAFLSSRTRCVSWFISGPARYPAARMNKRFDISDRRLADFTEFRKRAFAAIARDLDPTRGPIMASDEDAVERLAEKIAAAEADQEAMKAANAAVRKAAQGGPSAQITALRALGYTPAQIIPIMDTRWGQRVGFASYQLSNNLANIRRMRDRLDSLRSAKATPATSYTGAGDIRLEDDPPANRVRLFFPGKPDGPTRSTLKSHAFRWAPSVGAWQAFRNHRSLALARAIAGVDAAAAPDAVSAAEDAYSHYAA